MRQLTSRQKTKTTTNKKNKLVDMSKKNHIKQLLDEDIKKNILKSEEDYNNGKIRKAEDVFKEWETKFGI